MAGGIAFQFQVEGLAPHPIYFEIDFMLTFRQVEGNGSIICNFSCRLSIYIESGSA